MRAPALAAWAVVAIAVPPAARAQAVFTGSGLTTALDCGGGPARIVGSGNRLTIGGACASLSIEGAGNSVAIDLAPGRPVRIDGDGNRVLYRSPAGPPPTDTSGVGNTVLPDTRIGTAGVPPPPPPLLITAGSLYDQFCGGRDVLVQGDNLRFVLRGGCRSLTVQGASDRITAELLPGAPVLIGGAAVILNYVLVAEGPPPVVRVTAPGLKATQIQHFGDSQLSLPTGR